MNTSANVIIAALAEPHRQQIVSLLAKEGEMNATAIADRFEVSSAAISQHLKVLRESEVLTMTRQAQQRLYQLNPEAFGELEKWSRSMKETWTKRFDQLNSLLQQAG